MGGNEEQKMKRMLIRRKRWLCMRERSMSSSDWTGCLIRNTATKCESRYAGAAA